jgi:hypothetical protein
MRRIRSFTIVGAIGVAVVVGTQQASAVRSANGYTSDCPAALVVSSVRALARSFNAGNATAVDRLVAKEPLFLWFSAPGRTPAARRLGEASKDRTTLGEYVRERHLHHETLSLTQISTRDHAEGNFGLRLTRRADDYPQRTIDGKGAAVCNSSSAKLIVWSLGG